MKRIILIFMAFLFLFSSAPLIALEFIIGAKAGYYEWQPFFQDMKGSGVEEIDRGDGMLYGPIFSLLITENLSFSIAVLTGKQAKYWANENTEKIWGDNEITSNGTIYGDISRTDIDSALSYRLTERFKIIAGYKYQYVKLTYHLTSVQLKASGEEEVWDGGGDVKIPSHGPAVGFGYSLPLSDIFFITANLTGLYMWSKLEYEKMEYDIYRSSGTPNIFDHSKFTASRLSFDTKQIGLNLEPSIGATVHDNIILTLGFRYQWIRTKFVDEPIVSNMKVGPDGWMDDYIYGAFVSVMFVF